MKIILKILILSLISLTSIHSFAGPWGHCYEGLYSDLLDSRSAWFDLRESLRNRHNGEETWNKIKANDEGKTYLPVAEQTISILDKAQDKMREGDYDQLYDLADGLTESIGGHILLLRFVETQNTHAFKPALIQEKTQTLIDAMKTFRMSIRNCLYEDAGDGSL